MKEKDTIIHNWYGMVVFLNFQTEECHSVCRTWEVSDQENRCLSIKALSIFMWRVLNELEMIQRQREQLNQRN